MLVLSCQLLLRNLQIVEKVQSHQRLGFPIAFLHSHFWSETRVKEFYLFIVLIVSNFQREIKKLKKEGNQCLICSEKCKGGFF